MLNLQRKAHHFPFQLRGEGLVLLARGSSGRSRAIFADRVRFRTGRPHGYALTAHGGASQTVSTRTVVELRSLNSNSSILLRPGGKPASSTSH